MALSRKDFIKTLGMGGMVALSPGLLATPHAKMKKGISDDLKIGVASYSLRTLSLDDTIKALTRFSVTYVCLKSMHMPLDSTDEEIMSIAKKVRAAGLDLYGAGVIYMKTEDEVINAFRYAKAADLEVIVGVPNHELLPLTNELVQEHDIKVAIHNHGPGDELYPTAQSIYDRIQDLDPRVGMCLDIGHEIRIGLDAHESARKYADRIYDVHLKDVNVAAPEGHNIEMGHGVIDIAGFLKVLQDINYQGVVGIEYEKDGDDPLPGLAESLGYIRGILSIM